MSLLQNGELDLTRNQLVEILHLALAALHKEDIQKATVFLDEANVLNQHIKQLRKTQPKG